jgi:predicted RNA-binding Zn ribbon-like protein
MFNGYDLGYDPSGGRLPLDLANTLSRMSGDHLTSYRDLVAFAVQSGVLAEPEADRLMAAAAERSGAAAAALERARKLRRALFDLFAAAARGEPTPPAALDALNAELAVAGAHTRLAPSAGGYSWIWDEPPVALDRPIWPIARAAADLLADADELPRVRICAADDCDWLFIDLSKNRSRHWCDMRVCGNRAKVRRFYQRQRQAG